MTRPCRAEQRIPRRKEMSLYRLKYGISFSGRQEKPRGGRTKSSVGGTTRFLLFLSRRCFSFVRNFGFSQKITNLWYIHLRKKQ